MRIELLIDGKILDVDQTVNVVMTTSVADVEEPECSAAGYSQSFEVPFTSRNREALGFVEQTFTKDQFNNEQHKAEYRVDGICVMRGLAYMEKYTFTISGGSFHLSIVGESYAWVSNANKQVRSLNSIEKVMYRMPDIYANSISNTNPLIRFFPVDRGAFYEMNDDDEYVPREHLCIFDYHPFINIWKLLRLIFQGFTLRSSLASLFEELYISGYFPEKEDQNYYEEKNDFKAGTTIDFERVNTTNRLINLFDDLNNKDEGYFDNGVLVGGTRIFPYTQFATEDEITLRFEIELKYTAIVIGAGLVPYSYADTFIFGVGTDEVLKTNDEFYFPVSLSEEYKERTENPYDITADGHYYVYIDPGNNSQYKFFWFSDGGEYTVRSDMRSWLVYYRYGVGAAPLSILLSNSNTSVDGAVNILKAGDGAKVIIVPLTLFKESADEMIQSSLTFNRVVHTNPYTFGKGRNGFSFACAFRSSQTTTNCPLHIGEKCTIVPKFGNFIGWGDEVNISTVGGTDTQMNVISALRQLFNLMFYTNPLTREVFIEPRSRFFDTSGGYIDWRSKIDYDKDIEIEELGGEIGSSLKLAYAEGGDVVQWYNKRMCNKLGLGTYKVPLLNKTVAEEYEIANALYSPFLTRKIPSVGMTVLQNAVEMEQNTIDEADLNVTPVIGYFDGIAARTSGKDIVAYSRYPLLTYQNADKRINLGFEDLRTTDGIVAGLHQYYDDNVYLYNYGRRLTLYLKLGPQDVESINMPNRSIYDLRAVFMLMHEGENVPCLLEKVEEYDPAGGNSTKCSFIIDPRLSVSELTIITYDGEAVSYDFTVLGY